MILERMIQHIYPGKWADLEVIDKKYNVVEARLGFPAKKRYQLLMGSHPAGTLVIERQWPSLAAMEEANMKGFTDPEYQALQQEGAPIIKSVFWEVYMQLP
ncbi:MAG: hypothetical protein ABSF99_13755 [Anaerolineales bacterium]|jgi:hypothetical protein